MILLIDNYDSFVYNLARYIEELHHDCRVIRNDEMSVGQIATLKPDAIIISPGPCGPDQAGISLDVVDYFKDSTPILGVCLGHQVIAQYFGSKIRRSHIPMHGKASLITHTQQGIFEGLPLPLQVGRYHSLSVDASEELIIDATSPDEEIMAIHHKSLPIYGVQFHPESILTHHGHNLLKNFLKLAGVL